MEATVTWWLWIVVGLILVVLEAITPGGFYFIFFASAALVVGVLAGLGIAGPGWAQGLLFSVLSVAGLLALRKPLLRMMQQRMAGAGPVDSMAGEVALPQDDLPPGGAGKAEFRGTTWNARNADARELKRGQRCRVERVEGLTLWLKGE